MWGMPLLDFFPSLIVSIIPLPREKRKLNLALQGRISRLVISRPALRSGLLNVTHEPAMPCASVQSPATVRFEVPGRSFLYRALSTYHQQNKHTPHCLFWRWGLMLRTDCHRNSDLFPLCPTLHFQGRQFDYPHHMPLGSCKAGFH